MPIYEYKCEQCDHQLEILQKISADPVKTCPDCGQEGLRKLISAVAFRLKGGGWYETDFKDKPKQAGKAEGEQKTEPEKTAKSTDSADQPASTAKPDKPAKGKGKAEKTPAAGSGV